MKKNQKIKLIIGLFLIVIIFLVLNFIGFSKNIKSLFFSISLPIQKVFWQVGQNFSFFLTVVFSSQDLKNELNNLYSINQDLLGQIVFLKEMKKENEFLREALNLELEKDFNFVLARTISKDVFHDSILINKGIKDGISVGQPVITGQKAVLGTIGQVYDNFSEVFLISNKKSFFDAKIVDKEIYGLLKGQGNFKAYLDLIPRDKEIFENDLVITSILGGVYPANLLIGEISKINKFDVEPFQSAEIDLFFNLKNLDYLFIITDF